MSMKACGTVVVAGAADGTPSTVVGFCTDYGWTEAAEKIDVTTSCTRAYLAGPVEITITLGGFTRALPGTDPTQDSGQALLRAGNTVSLAIRPNGTGSGKPQAEWTNVTIDNLALTGNVAGAWQYTLSATGNVATDETAQT